MNYNLTGSFFLKGYKKQLLLLAILLGIGFYSQAQISGTVFRDFNFDGVRTTTSGATSTAEPLVAGIVVNAYNNSNVIIASYTTTNGSGTAATYPYTGNNFIIPASGTAYNGTPGSNTGFIPSGTKVRLEFVAGSSTCAIDPPSRNGTANGTSVQFLTAGAGVTTSYAINNPADYNTGTTGVSVFIPRHISGNPLGGGTSGSQSWFFGFPYTSNGAVTPPPQSLNGTTIGACWGVAYSRQAKKIFTSAILKRHVGLGQMGVGGIYLLEPTASSFNVTQFFDMDDNSFNTAANPVTRVSAAGLAGAPAYGSSTSYSINATNNIITYLGANDPLTGKPAGLGVVGTNVNRGLNAAANIAAYDPAAFEQVGKVGMGDIDISDDGRYLFVMNLYQRKVFRLELNDAYNPTAVVAITSYTVPAATATNGEIRPWGIEFYKDKLYVGAIASGEYQASASNTNLRAYVFELNNATGSAIFNTTPLLNYPLTYTKGRADASIPSSNLWTSWINNVSLTSSPQPMLTDLEIDEKGDLMMAFSDRMGHIFYENNRQFLATDLGNFSPIIGGDILIAGKSCATGFTLENNGAYTAEGVSFSSGTANSEGPGGSEFFKGDNTPPSNAHRETSQGAMAVLNGSNEVFLAMMDPVNLSSGGTRRLSTVNGSIISNGSYQLYGQGGGHANKGNGLGDVELLTPLSPIEIGNRLWYDDNNNGIQDADETDITKAGAGTNLASKTVTLRSPGIDRVFGTADDQTWTTTTDAQGRYYFNVLSSSDNRRSASMVSAGAYANSLLPDSAYRIETTLPTGFGVAKRDEAFRITAGPNTMDTRDNDAQLSGGIAVIMDFTTSVTNHNLDIGFIRNVNLSGNVFHDVNALTDNTVNSTSAVPIPTGLYANLLDESGNVVATVPINPDGSYNFNNITANSAYSVQISTNQGTVGQPAPAIALPAGWANTGENIGAGAGNDGGIPNGSISSIVVDATDVTEINFGIQQLPESAVNSQVIGLNPGGTINTTVSPSWFENSNVGANPNTGDPNGGTVTSIRITAFPSNATSITINGVTYTSATWPVGGVTVPYTPGVGPTQAITVDPADGIINVVIPFAAIDNAGKEDPTPGSVTLSYSAILPINLVSFTAQPQGSSVRLNWVVDAEINVLQYEIEYSRNSTDFTSIGSTPATGNRNYGLVHGSPGQGLNYYRLKVIDKDGKISYSEVRKVNFGKADVVTVFPVPAHSEMNITLPGSLVNKAVMISVIAMDGKILISKQVAAASQTETLDVHTLASGRYTIRIMSGTTLIIKSVEVMRQGYH